MTLKRTAILMAGACAGAFAAGFAASPATQPEQPEMPPEMLEAYARATTPDEHHRVLELMLGSWEGEVTMWFAPGAEPMVSRGRIEREMAMDGRFVIEHVRGETPEGEFQGLGIVGYNTVEGHFESVWIENMATYMSFATGSYDAESGVFTMHGDMLDPMTGARVGSRFVMDMSDPRRHVTLGYAEGPDGVEFKNFEGVFERTD